MKEIGGYIELEQYHLPMLHDNAIALNSARNCLAYLIKARKIKSILLPRFLCDSVDKVCRRENVCVRYYSINESFMPQDISLLENEWLYLVNYYGQLTNSDIEMFYNKYNRVIVDQVQAYFQMPVGKVDTIYTCRKFFGVSDGAFLYSEVKLDEELSQDISYQRMNFLLGRYEKTASEFYKEYVSNNDIFEKEPIKIMSKLTDNLLRAIDYETVKNIRTTNFTILHKEFQSINKLKLKIPKGAFMYPLYIPNGEIIREKLCSEKIYIPMLWPDVLDCCSDNSIEFDMARNILPLPVDQRYGLSEMLYIIKHIKANL